MPHLRKTWFQKFDRWDKTLAVLGIIVISASVAAMGSWFVSGLSAFAGGRSSSDTYEWLATACLVIAAVALVSLLTLVIVRYIAQPLLTKGRS